MDTVVRARDLGKKYVIGHDRQDTYLTLRDEIAGRLRSASRRLIRPLGRALPVQEDSVQEEFWALRDVNFEIRQGERVGIIGRNGAGKSTLLKLLSRITEPTLGRIEIRGRVTSLLEVGTGFHPELTGRENIYLNGAVLGMTRKEIKSRFEEIVSFAEIEKFLDTPVKRYSSGMYVRLAFSVAAHLEPEILIVDEVLAVGDYQFQRKCLGKMSKVAHEGRTVIFVSHNMAAIKALCEKGIVLEQGRLALIHDVQNCVAFYEAQSVRERSANWIRSSRQAKNGLEIVQIKSTLTGKQPVLALELQIMLESHSHHNPAFLAIDILDSFGLGLMQALPRLEGFLLATRKEHLINVTVDLPPLIPGPYLVSVWVGGHNTETLDEVKEAVAFEIHDSPTIGRAFQHSSDHGYIVPESKIRDADGDRH